MPEDKTEKQRAKQQRTAQALRQRLGKIPADSSARSQTQRQVRKTIIETLRRGTQTVPAIAESTGLPSHQVLWHLMAMKKYGRLVEGQQRDDYYEYALSAEEERNVAAPGSKPVRTTLEVQPLGVGYYSVDLPSSIDVDVPEAWSLPLSPYEVGGWASIGVMLSFDTRPGEVYEIQFSDDGKTWQPAMPHLQASGVQAFWIDKGAPKTPTHPMLTIVPGGIPAPLRLYRVVELPGLPQ